MRVELAYGRAGLAVTVPDSATVIEPRYVPGLAPGSAAEAEALRLALREPIGCGPLAERVRPGDRVVIVHTDLTRATPNDRLLPVLLAELEAGGVRRDDTTLLNGLGTHRPQTQAELRGMVGDQVVDNYRCHQHDCHAADLVPLGATALGHPVRINREYLEADVRILTGFIEPHFFAGFSGGPKAVLPSLAGAESVATNHAREMIAHPRATWGVTEGNPIWMEMAEVAVRTRPTFLLNVTLNTRREITGVYAGDVLAAHAQGCERVRAEAMAAVDAPFDVVLVTNSGYPLDQNLYQCVKGMSAACQIVRPGGAIVLAAACADGLPDHGRYAALLAEAGSPQGVLQMLARPGFCAQDQWQVQIQAQIQLRAQVWVYSQGLTDEQITRALFRPCRDLEETLGRLLAAYGPAARLAVLPQGPLSVPYVRS